MKSLAPDVHLCKQQAHTRILMVCTCKALRQFINMSTELGSCPPRESARMEKSKLLNVKACVRGKKGAKVSIPLTYVYSIHTHIYRNVYIIHRARDDGVQSMRQSQARLPLRWCASRPYASIRSTLVLVPSRMLVDEPQCPDGVAISFDADVR